MALSGLGGGVGWEEPGKQGHPFLCHCSSLGKKAQTEVRRVEEKRRRSGRWI